MEFQILAAGPFFKFNESISFVINCKDQAEVDTTGKRSPPTVVQKANADGVKTNTDSLGKWYLSNITS